MNRVACTLFLLLLCIAVGCSSNEARGPKVVTVSGAVKMDGKPMEGGTIRFSLPGQPAKSTEIKNGNFSGEAYVGKNVVEVLWEKEGAPNPMDPKGPRIPVNVVADRYFGPKSAPLPANTFDFALSARSFHGWMGSGLTDKFLKDLYGALKPGGILAIEQHRANPGEQDPKASSGYVTEAYVIEQAQKAGFELADKSEINANAQDTKDHPFGVWTLPPTKRTRPYSEGADANDPKFDRSKYDAIGESDRMTLKFRKPESATT